MRQTAVGQATALRQRDQLFDIGAQFLRLGVVVVICSCLISEAAMLRSRAMRCGWCAQFAMPTL
jgi:hypothetical protein